MSVDDLEVEEELGRGQYGQVNRMKHKPTGKIMAVKVCALYDKQKSIISLPPPPLSPSLSPQQRIRATPDQAENKRLLMDYNVAMRSVDCPFTIMFYGALFREVCYQECY